MSAENRRPYAQAFLKDLRSRALEFLFPRLCFGCSRGGSWLCQDCYARIPEALVPVEPPGRDTPLSGIIAGAPYGVPIVRKLIHSYKYRFQKDAAEHLAALMARAVRRTALPLPDILTFVPLHPRRERYRGFNQAKLLAEALAASLTPGIAHLAARPLLARTRPTLPQMKTRSRAMRQENLKGAFTLLPTEAPLKRPLQGKTVWIVDDVATTGTTLSECATELRKAGARHVYGVVVAK